MEAIMSTASTVAACTGKCADLVQITIVWGKWFLIAALAVALSSAAVTLWERIRNGGAGGPQLRSAPDGTPLPAVLQALSALIDTLAKAPAWFAMYLAGLALLWVGGTLLSPP